MTVLIVAAIIIAVLAIIFFIPIKCEAYLSYTNNVLDRSFDLKYGFIRIRLPKSKETVSEAADETAKDAEKETEEKPDKVKSTISFVRANITELKEALCKILGYMFRHAVTINQIDIKLIFGTEDAMQTGLLFGAAAAFIYNVLGVMDKKMRLRKHREEFKPDFKNPHIFAEAGAIITTNLFNLAALAVIMLLQILPLYKKHKSMKGEHK
ncbi:MAG: DUF2953 domain-containing protein [Clostridiales bacterium]|nr:DUF2953 domain-containing protein [Clostridiales bacterium]